MLYFCKSFMVKSKHLNSFNVSSSCVITNVVIYLFFVTNQHRWLSVSCNVLVILLAIKSLPSHVSPLCTLKLNSEQKMKIYDQNETSILACRGILMRQ